MLAPLLENACQHGTAPVTVSAARRNGAVEFLIADEGPGIPEHERERVFEPGFSRHGNGPPTDRGAGLGLSLARRLARAAEERGGLAQGPGANFVVRLPSGLARAAVISSRRCPERVPARLGPHAHPMRGGADGNPGEYPARCGCRSRRRQHR